MPLSSSKTSPEEWSRFLKSNKGDTRAAIDMLDNHLAWRARTIPLPPGEPSLGKELPDLLVFAGITMSGHRSVILYAAMYDVEKGNVEKYTNAIAFKLDTNIDRNDTEKITLLIDTRGGEGWPNPSAMSVLPFLKAVSQTLSANFPERLHAAIVFPVPRLASAIWGFAKPFLDPHTAEVVNILHGPADRNAQVPEDLSLFADRDCIKVVEMHRNERILSTKAL